MRKKRAPVIQFPSPNSPFLIEKYKKRNWAIKHKDTDVLIALTVYKKGAKELVRLLEELMVLRRRLEGIRLAADLYERQLG